MANPKKKVNKMPSKGIVINRMFSGNYLLNNLGHEIINIFKADNDRCYVYLNPSGKLTKENSGVDTMLMVQTVGNNTVEVIAKATGLRPVPGVLDRTVGDYKNPDSIVSKKQEDYILQNDIRYGGISLLDIFNESEQQNVYITFEAEAVMFPKDRQRIFIHYGKDSKGVTPQGKMVVLKERNYPNYSLRNFIYPKGVKGNKDDAYDLLMREIVNDANLWDSKGPDKIPPADQICGCNGQMQFMPHKINLFDICGIQDRENCFTNALGFFMNQSNLKSLWCDLFKKLNINLSVDFKVNVEVGISVNGGNNKKNGGRIDLLIEDKDNVVVIENKIKSGINTCASDEKESNQLERYIEYVENEKTAKGKKHYYILLSPEYNKPVLTGRAKDFYEPITYTQIYDFLNGAPYNNLVKSDDNFQAFHDAMYRHTLSSPSAYLRIEMQMKFYNRICKYLSNKTSKS